MLAQFSEATGDGGGDHQDLAGHGTGDRVCLVTLLPQPAGDLLGGSGGAKVLPGNVFAPLQCGHMAQFFVVVLHAQHDDVGQAGFFMIEHPRGVQGGHPGHFTVAGVNELLQFPGPLTGASGLLVGRHSR